MDKLKTIPKNGLLCRSARKYWISEHLSALQKLHWLWKIHFIYELCIVWIELAYLSEIHLWGLSNGFCNFFTICATKSKLMENISHSFWPIAALITSCSCSNVVVNICSYSSNSIGHIPAKYVLLLYAVILRKHPLWIHKYVFMQWYLFLEKERKLYCALKNEFDVA